MVRVAGWLTIAVVCFAVAPVHAGGHRDLDAYQRAYGWYAPGQHVHDDHRYELGAHGIAYRGTERPAWRWCDERGEWLRITEPDDLGWQGGIDPADVHARIPRHLHDPSLLAVAAHADATDHGYADLRDHEVEPAYAVHGRYPAGGYARECSDRGCDRADGRLRRHR